MPPSQAQVEVVQAWMLSQAKRTFEVLDAPWPEDAFERLQVEGAQERLNRVDKNQLGQEGATR